jgi:hypothetical protein
MAEGQFNIGGKPVICPSVVPLDLLFFRRIFSNLHRRYGNGAGEVPVAVFQRSVVRLFRLLGMRDVEFNAEEYDVDGSGAVGWFEFVTCWRKSKMSVMLTNAERAFLAMEDPGTCFLGALLSGCLMTLIFANCTCFMLATMPNMKHQKDDCPRCEPEVLSIFEWLEGICVAIFSLEYGLRLALAPISRSELLDYEKIMEMVTEHEELRIPSAWERLLRFLIQPMNIIDLFAIAPYYMEVLLDIVASNLTVLRVLRLTRLFRIVKLGRYLEVLQLVVRVFNKSLQVLFVLLIYLILAVCFSAAVIFFLEGGTWDPDVQEYVRSSHEGERSVSPFKSIPHSFWWCIVTFTTVGYGDVVPVTTLGKLVAASTMLGGVLVLAMPISAISMNFAEVWASWCEERRMEAEARMVDVVSVSKALEGMESRNRVLLEVYDSQIGNSESEFLGEVELSNLPVDSMEVTVKADEIVPLESNLDKKATDKVSGALVFGFTWTPYNVHEEGGHLPGSIWGQLEVRVQRAEGLMVSDWKKGGMRDAFVVVHAWPQPPANLNNDEDCRSKRLETRIVSDSLNPVWNEKIHFEFDWPRDWQSLEERIFSGPEHFAPTDSFQPDALRYSASSRSLSKNFGSASQPHLSPNRSSSSLDVMSFGRLRRRLSPTSSHHSSDFHNPRSPHDHTHATIEASDVTQLRHAVASQGQELKLLGSRVAEMHSTMLRLEALLLPAHKTQQESGKPHPEQSMSVQSLQGEWAAESQLLAKANVGVLLQQPESSALMPGVVSEPPD